MNRNWKNSWPIFFLIALLSMASCGQESDHSEHADVYTCPMHPAVTSDRPGTCPVCGMDLVRKARAGEEIAITEELSRLIKSPNETVVSSIRTVRGQYKAVPIDVPAQGVVTYDTRNINAIAARAGGRLEKLYLRSAFQPVAKGQKVAALYSPELVTAQREFVFLLENDADNPAIIDAARRKLALLGLTRRQIDNLAQTKEVRQTIDIYSPHTGYLMGPVPESVTKVWQAGGDMNNSMGSADRSRAVDGNVLIKEGDYISPGQTLFTIVNPNALRIELNLPGSYADMVREGHNVTLDLGTGEPANASVDFVQPFFADGQEFLKMRVYVDDAVDLFIGQLVDAVVHLGTSEGLWVPKASVVDLGTRKIVFVKEHGVLKPKEITIGSRAAGMIQVSAGLSSTDEIADNAQYLVDSESFIKLTK